jgi:peptidoglycan hydrolase-like protein with peptidoglycan-binding domain
MRQNLLRLALALLVICAIVPASAQARQGGPAAHEPASAMPEGWSAGPVHRWTGYHRAGGSRRVRELQRRLNRLGYRAGPVDGLFGPRTERATRRFQRRHGLRVDAIAGPRTLTALRRRDGARRGAPTTAPAPAQARPEVHAPLPDRIPVTASPSPADAPADPAPDLPVVPVLVAFALLGIAAFARGFLRTTARIQRLQREGRQAVPRGPTIHGEPGR